MPKDLKQTVMEAPGGLWLYKISDWSGDSIRFEESQRELHSCPSTQRYLKFETSETWGVELTLAQSEAFAESILAKVNEIRQHG
jgi:hypothetical protein